MKSRKIGLFFKYDPEIGKWSQNPENHDVWGKVDRYGFGFNILQKILNFSVVMVKMESGSCSGTDKEGISL